MLVGSEVTAAPLAIPPAEHPGPEDASFLREWGVSLGRAVAAGLSALSTRGTACVFSDYRVLVPDWRPAPETVSLRWGTPGPLWQLCLPEPAVAVLLAGLLGHPSLAPGHLLSPADLALLELQARQVSRQVSQELSLPQSSLHSVVKGADLLPESPRVCFGLQLQTPSVTVPLELLAGWPQISVFNPLRAATEARLSVSDLTHAALVVDAILPGPVLAARDLLGLQPGDIVQLGSTQRPTVLQVGGRAVAVGRAGARAGALAVNIHEVANLTESGSHGT